MKPSLKVFVSLMLFGAIACIGIAVADRGHLGKWLSSAGLMFDIAGIAQLDIVGFFQKILDQYGNVDKYPYGPPSHITRKIIDNPDTPARNWIERNLFYEHQTGFYMIVIGFFLQLAGVWV